MLQQFDSAERKQCSWVSVGTRPCDESASLWHNLVLCDEHKVQLTSKLTGTIRGAAKHHPINAFPGVCYAILTPSGYVKIGYSNKEYLFKKRIRNLDSQHEGRVALLAKLPGGFVAEALLHYQLARHRLPGSGELFYPHPDVAAAIRDIAQTSNGSIEWDWLEAISAGYTPVSRFERPQENRPALSSVPGKRNSGVSS